MKIQNLFVVVYLLFISAASFADTGGRCRPDESGADYTIHIDSTNWQALQDGLPFNGEVSFKIERRIYGEYNQIGYAWFKLEAAKQTSAQNENNNKEFSLKIEKVIEFPEAGIGFSDYTYLRGNYGFPNHKLPPFFCSVN